MKPTDVLVLNQTYVPIHIVSWKKGLSLVYTEKCIALDREFLRYETFDEWIHFSYQNRNEYPIIHTSRYGVAVPEIIASITFNKLPRREVKFSRQNIFSRDGFKCVYCGSKYKKEDLTFDHIVPKSRGGRNSWENTVTSCFRCNQKKADKSLKEAGMSLKTTPSKPKWIGPIHSYDPNTHPCKSWKHFMDRFS